MMFLTIISFSLLIIIMAGMLDGIDRWIKHLSETTDLFESYN